MAYEVYPEVESAETDRQAIEFVAEIVADGIVIEKKDRELSKKIYKYIVNNFKL